MRSEQEILELILNTAKSDDRIRAVIMNGSRTNPNAPRDIFQDFDILYLVTQVTPFTDDHMWIQRFGELMILQMPEAMQDPPPGNDGSFAYLMQFTDGNRIDLTLLPVAKLNELGNDSLSLLLLDKDGLLQPFALPSDSDYLPQPPTAQAFSDCCNEFWWMNSYVAKGLWRGELTYAKWMMEVVQEQLMDMLTWYFGIRTDFKKAAGKQGKYIKEDVEPEIWAALEKTYSDYNFENNWESLFTAGNLFRRLANAVAGHFDFQYPQKDDENVSAFLRRIKNLPKDAKQI